MFEGGQERRAMSKRKRKKEDGSKNDVKFKGVRKSGKKFRANIRIDGKTQSLGTFDTPKEAAQAYDRAAIQAGRPTSKLNFLDQVPKFYKPKNKKLSSNNTTGYRGVVKKGNRFQARIMIGGTRQNIGIFDTTKEAAIAWDLAAVQAKRLKSDLNFPFLYDCRVIESSPKLKKRRIGNYKNNTGFNGVSKKGKKFQATININGKQKFLGIFTRARDAAMAYDEAIVELSGRSIDELKLNFPDGMSKE